LIIIVDFLKKPDILLNMATETVTLTETEKSKLWSKLEFRKKKQAIETLNELHVWFHGPKTEFSRDERTKILKSLEYTFKQKLLAADAGTELAELAGKIK